MRVVVRHAKGPRHYFSHLSMVPARVREPSQQLCTVGLFEEVVQHDHMGVVNPDSVGRGGRGHDAGVQTSVQRESDAGGGP